MFFFFDFWLFGLFRLWDLYQYEKPEFVSMNCLKDSSRHGLELEIQTPRPRKTSKRTFLVEGILVGVRWVGWVAWVGWVGCVGGLGKSDGKDLGMDLG